MKLLWKALQKNKLKAFIAKFQNQNFLNSFYLFGKRVNFLLKKEADFQTALRYRFWGGRREKAYAFLELSHLKQLIPIECPMVPVQGYDLKGGCAAKEFMGLHCQAHTRVLRSSLGKHVTDGVRALTRQQPFHCRWSLVPPASCSWASFLSKKKNPFWNTEISFKSSQCSAVS